MEGVVSLSETDKYDYSPIRPSELKAVYLGCQSQPDFQSDVRRSLREKYPQTRLFVARKAETTYALTYTDA